MENELIDSLNRCTLDDRIRYKVVFNNNKREFFYYCKVNVDNTIFYDVLDKVLLVLDKNDYHTIKKIDLLAHNYQYVLKNIYINKIKSEVD